MPVPALTSVIVVAADSGATLEECIRCVLASSAPFELIVADNASSDGAIERLQQHYGDDARVRILRNGTNLGFGPACNRAAQIAQGEALLFLNPDCFIDPDTIEKLSTQLAQHADAGLIGACICDAAGMPARGNRRRDPLLRRALMSVSGLSRWQQRWSALQGVEMPPPAFSEAGVESVEAVSGALMLLPRALFEKLGGFDPGYFLHCEDLDLCWRVRDAGHRVLFVGAIRVTHRQGSSSRHRPVFVARHKHRGMWRWFQKFDPAARNPLLRGIVWLGIWAHFAIVWPRLALSAWRQPRAAPVDFAAPPR